jgi:hypothetical protein
MITMGGKPGLPQAKLQNHEGFMIVMIGVHEYFSRGRIFGAILNPVCLTHLHRCLQIKLLFTGINILLKKRTQNQGFYI